MKEDEYFPGPMKVLFWIFLFTVIIGQLQYLEKSEEIIDDIERDPEITKTLILEALYKVKEEAEDINLQEEENY